MQANKEFDNDGRRGIAGVIGLISVVLAGAATLIGCGQPPNASSGRSPPASGWRRRSGW
jgi:hypothetical protein